MPRNRNGETRTCPYCGQRSVFRERVQVPDVEGQPAPAAADAPTAPKFKAGWVCENRKCSRRYDFL